MGSDKEETEPRYYGLELGIVADNVDPKGLGRVRLIVHGIIEQPSPWAPQVGTLSGGGPQRGAFSVPDIGSDVGVLFHRGDPERPYYIGGHFGEPAGGAEVPEDVKEVPPEKRHETHGFDTKAWKLFIDDRAESQAIRFKHKHLDLAIEIDGKKGTVDIAGEVAVNVKATGLVNIAAPQIQIGGRTVLQNGKPIS